jgi:hypothetical protein
LDRKQTKRIDPKKMVNKKKGKKRKKERKERQKKNVTNPTESELAASAYNIECISLSPPVGDLTFHVVPKR